MSKLFSCDYLTIRRNADGREDRLQFNQEKIMNFEYYEDRSSHQRCLLKKGVLRNFTKFTGKHLLNRVAGLRQLRPTGRLRLRPASGLQLY